MRKNILVLLLIFISMILFPFATRAEGDFEKEYGNFLTYYYLKPAPDKAPLVLEKFISSDYFKTNQDFQKYGIYNIAYSFGRIAQTEPFVIEKYEEIFNKASHAGRSFILKIFQICGNDQVKDFLTARLKDNQFSKEKVEIEKVMNQSFPIKINPLDKEVKDANNLDFLWAEFFITGDKKSVQKIIDVIEKQDRIREKLQLYINKDLSISEQKKITELLDKIGIKCRISQKIIDTEEDLDIVCSAYLSNRPKNEPPSQSFIEFRKIIGLNNNEDIVYSAVKGVAAWALESNAQQHERAFEICNEENKVRSKPTVKIILLKILSSRYLSEGNRLAAIEKLKELVTLSPNDKNTHYTLGLAYTGQGDLEDASRELTIVKGMNSAMANGLERELMYGKLKAIDVNTFTENKISELPDQVLGSIINAINGLKSYQSRLIMRNYLNKKLKSKDYVFVEWRFGYEQPEKFSVEQYANEDDHSLYDMWSSAEGAHYNLLPPLGWIKDTNEESIKNKTKLNYDLSIKKYAKLIQQNKPNTSSLYEDQKNGVGYYVFKYNPPESGWDFYTYDIKNPQYNAEIWIDKTNLLPVKAFIKVTYKDKDSGKEMVFDFMQLFMNYNNTAVQAPLKTWNEKKQEFMNPEEFQEIAGKW